MPGENFSFTGSGAFSNAANWTPSVGAPPRSGQAQNIVMSSRTTLDASGQPWEDFDVWVLATGAAILFSGPRSVTGSELGFARSVTRA